jgi:hypothetical protein
MTGLLPKACEIFSELVKPTHGPPSELRGGLSAACLMLIEMMESHFLAEKDTGAKSSLFEFSSTTLASCSVDSAFEHQQPC